MKNYFNQRKSKLLLFLLFAFFAGSMSPAWAQKALPYSYGFEEASCSTSGWTEKNCNNSSENYNVGSSGVHEGTYAYRFYYNSNPPQYLISPELATSTYPLSVSFWYKAESSSWTESFKLGYSTTDTEIDSFTFEEEVTTKSTTWTEYTTTCPAGTKYICIAYTANNKYYLYIDDLNIEDASPYTTPKAFAATSITATAATFAWTNGKDETAWQIAYSTTEGFDAESATKVDVNTNPYTLEGLTAETTYYARIRANYGSGNYSSWSDEISFTPTNAITTTVNDGSATNAYVPFYGSYVDTEGTKSQFIIPSSTLTALQGRQITKLTFYDSSASLDFGTAKFNVLMKETEETTFDGTTFDWTDMNEVATNAAVSVSDGKMVITLDDPFDYTEGNLMIGFNLTATGSWKATKWVGVNSGSAIYYYNGSGNSTSFLPKVTFTSLPGTPVAVKKPKSLAASEVAATTATLGWTDGEEGLSAWQIAYSTNADFNPESEGTTVDADANPYTLTELTASTTYYAYVRAKKGDDYSSWSNKVEFTTLSAVPVMVLSTTSINFGIVSDPEAQAQTFTVTNEGGAAMNAFSVKPAGEGFTVTDTEGNELPNTIAVGSSVTVKVKMNALGSHTTDLVITAGGEVPEQRVTVTGYMLDNTKIAEVFTAAAPAHWTEYAYKSSYSTFNWSYSTDGAYNSNENSALISPKITVAEGETLTVYGKLKSSASYGYITVEGSADNGETWTAYTKKLDYEAFSSTTNEFQLITLSDVPTTVNKLRFKCYYAYLNTVNGFTYAADPVLALYSNEACTSSVAAEVNRNFGFVAEQQEQKYYIKNTGTGQIDLAVNTPEGFTAAIDDVALTENEVAVLTISMPATEGLHNAAIIVTATNHDTDTQLGTFTVNANGAVAGSKNDVNFAILSELPAGWETTNWTVTANSYVGVGYTAGDLITSSLTVSEGETLLVEAKGSSSYYSPTLTYCYKTGDADWTEATAISGVAYSDWKIFAITGIPAGEVKVKFNGQYTNIRRVYGFEAKVEPIMTFAATNHNFGMVTTATTTDAYTIQNDGSATLQNLSVTSDNSNITVAVADDATEIAAGQSVTFTVTLGNETPGLQNATITVAGDDVESKTFQVSGFVADDSKIFETFTALPDRWTNNGWSFSANGATATSSSSKLESPKLKIAEGEKLAISAMQRYAGSNYYVTIKGSSDNGATWTAYTKTLNNEQLNNTAFTVVELDDIPTTVNKLQLVGYYVYVNGLNGFTYDDNDPELAVFSNAECTAAINATTATNAWGFVSEDKAATYYIKNTGTGTMTLTATDAPEGFTAVLGATALAAGESTSLTIGMKNDAENNEGYHTGNVVLTATDSESNVLGTFTITSSGVVVGSKTDINFAELTAFPAGWEATNWSVTSGVAKANSYSAGTITTGTYTVAEGETMILEAARNSSSSYATIALNYSYSADGGNTWSQAKAITPASTTKELIAISDIPAGDVLIRFTGTYIDIFRIYGYTAVAKANMALDKTAIDFGMQTASADETITVTNNGTAELTGLTATLAKTGDDAEYTVSLSATTIAVGESATITVTQLFDAANGLATLSDVLTISADGLADKTVNLSGKTRDASKQYIDFADGNIPATFVETGSWSASSQYASTTSSTETSMVTQPLTVAAGEKICFDAKNPYSGSLKVRYSINGGISWSDYTDYTSEIGSSAFTTLTLDLGNETDVTAVVEFCGRYYVQLDNIYGGTPNATAPMIAVKKSGNAVANGSTEEFGAISAQATATYTIKNAGNGTLTITSPIAVTGAATATVDDTELAAGETATLTITMPAQAPYGAKEGAVTVVTSLGDFVINYTATVLNPDALDEQFANGKPAGWYFNEYWRVSNQEAAQEETSAAVDFITEQLTVADESDALTFQVARTSSYSAPSFAVYTSQDRLNWTAVDLGDLTLTTSYQTVTVSGLAAGNYYVKVSGARIKVDNFLGWEKVNNTRDLFVTAASFPATTEKGSEATITATVTSLIAAEEGVYAKLFVNDEQVGDDAEAQTIALNGTQTFSFTYAVPENVQAQVKVYYSDNSEAFATAVNSMKVNYTLDETAAPGDIAAGTFDITLNRVFKAGWNTVCVPFTIDAANIHTDAKAYSFDAFDANSGELTLNQVETLDAGMPYIIYVPEEVSSLSLSNTTIVSTAAEASSVEYGGITFKGSYAPIASGNLVGCHGVTTAGLIAKASATASMKGFRAYFENVPANARIAYVDNDGETTSISGIEVANRAAKGAIYNLAGQKVERISQPGIYIINGKKQVVK